MTMIFQTRPQSHKDCSCKRSSRFLSNDFAPMILPSFVISEVPFFRIRVNSYYYPSEFARLAQISLSSFNLFNPFNSFNFGCGFAALGPFVVAHIGLRFAALCSFAARISASIRGRGRLRKKGRPNARVHKNQIQLAH
jgi:hypothetical protein